MKHTIGGQALIEGVMIRSNKRTAAAARKPNGKIVETTYRNPSPAGGLNVPFIRGILYLWDHLVLGFRALSWSADQQTGEDEEITGWTLTLAFGASFIVAVLLFVVAPYYLSRVLFAPNTFTFNLFDGILRLVIFLGYLSCISLMPDVRRLFAYHGAEHKAVYCYEADKPLTVANVQKFSTKHPRCGTSLIIFVIAVSIIVFSLIRFSWYWNLLLRILVIPLIGGISYELLKATSRVRWLAWAQSPGIWLQHITTREPDRKQVEVAIAAVKRAVR